MKPKLAIIAAIGRNGAIGRDNKLPWSMPGDLRHFKAMTMGTPMIMGRRTFESIGRVLPGRDSIVVSHDRGLDLPDRAFWAPDPDAALQIAARRAEAMGAGTVSLIGGSRLFEALMPVTDRLHLTWVDLSPEADTFFPPIDPAMWRETARIAAPRHADDEAACVFVDYLRA